MIARAALLGAGMPAAGALAFKCRSRFPRFVSPSAHEPGNFCIDSP